MSSPWLTGCFVSAPPKHRAPRNGLRGSLWWGGHEASDQGQITKAGHWLEPHNLSKEQDRPAFFGRFLEAPGSVSASTSSSSAAVFHRPSTTQPDSSALSRARRQAGALPVASLISTPRSPGRPVDEAIRLFPQTTSSTRVRVDLLVPELTTVVSFSRVLAISRSAISSATPALIMPRVTSSASWGSSGQRGRSCSRHRSQYSVCLCRW